MMRMPTFTYRGPQSLDEACRMLSEDSDQTRLVAGGTDLWPNMKRRHQQAKTVIGLRGIEELFGINGDPNQGVRIGAMATLTDVCSHPMVVGAFPGLARAVGSISAPVLRNMGTLGGNLCLDTRCTYYNQNEEWRQAIGYCMKEVGETCWVATKSSRCWAISASDSAPLLCAIGAQVRIVSKEGERTIPVADLFREDGIDYLTLQKNEILAEIILPKAEDVHATYWKLRRRGAIDFPVLGVGANLKLANDGKTVEDVRVYIGAVVSAPTESIEARDFLIGKTLDDETAAEAGRLAQKVTTPLGNTDYEIPWRKQMVAIYVEGVLRELGGLPAKTFVPPHGLWAMGA